MQSEFWQGILIAYSTIMSVVSSFATLVLIIYGIAYLSERV